MRPIRDVRCTANRAKFRPQASALAANALILPKVNEE
jgi:hypothetical protein